MKNTILIFFFVCKGFAIDDVGGARDTVSVILREIRSEAGFETSEFVKEMLGGLP